MKQTNISRQQRFTRVEDTIGGKHYIFRSMFEWNWAKYLQFLKEHKTIKDWAYEPQTFDFRQYNYRNKPYEYTPDFLINDRNGIYFQELKGQLTTKDLSKYRRLSEHYPDVVIEIVMQRIPKSGKGFELYSKLKQHEGGSIRRIFDGSAVLKQVKGCV